MASDCRGRAGGADPRGSAGGLAAALAVVNGTRRSRPIVRLASCAICGGEFAVPVSSIGPVVCDTPGCKRAARRRRQSGHKISG